MPSLPHSTSPTCLIVGCGYLGQHLARLLLADGREVFGTARTPERGEQLAQIGVRALLVDITQPLTFASLTPALASPALDVFFLVPPGRPGGDPPPQKVLGDGLNYFLRALDPACVRSAVLASSTAVYGQHHGQSVTADTPAQPASSRGELLLDAENRWLAAGPEYRVVRLAGLYGPGRTIGARAVREGAPLVGDPNALLNLLHIEDAAALMYAIARSRAAASIELGADGHPVPRQTYYQHLASLLGVPEPQLLSEDDAQRLLGLSADRLRRSGSKACDPMPTIQRTGWSPRYADFREGLKTCFRPSRRG